MLAPPRRISSFKNNGSLMKPASVSYGVERCCSVSAVFVHHASHPHRPTSRKTSTLCPTFLHPFRIFAAAPQARPPNLTVCGGASEWAYKMLCWGNVGRWRRFFPLRWGPVAPGGPDPGRRVRITRPKRGLIRPPRPGRPIPPPPAPKRFERIFSPIPPRSAAFLTRRQKRQPCLCTCCMAALSKGLLCICSIGLS